MASSQSFLLVSLLFFSILSVNYTVKCDEEENLLRGINSYRATLNLTALTDNERADCLADELADQFKKQPCTNTSGPNTIPGTEPQFPDFPNLLSKCKLNVTTISDGSIMPACVPKLDANLVLSNYTQTQYAGFLNDTKYTGIGIGSDDDWIVVILTTNTPQGSYLSGSNDVVGTNSANLVSEMNMLCIVVFMLSVFFSLLS